MKQKKAKTLGARIEVYKNLSSIDDKNIKEQN